jgi:hypothetical protein
VKILTAPVELPDEEVDPLAGHFLTPEHYDLLVEGETTRVNKPDGSPLLVYVRNAIPTELGAAAYQILSESIDYGDQGSRNRGIAGGYDEQGNLAVYRPTQKGTRSNTRVSANPVRSAIVGYFDRYTRMPFCRLCNYTRDNPEQWHALQPYIKHVDRVFAEHLPEQYARQRDIADRTSQDFVIKDTAFTTITVNESWRTATHKDAGDFRDGFGVMACLTSGTFQGGHLVMPKYRVGVAPTSCDVLLFDVHQWHGNTAMVGNPKRFRRLTQVFYYREKMIHCGTAEQELDRAKNRKPGDPLWD